MNEVVPSGVLLQRLIQNSHTDILNREKNNDRFMHLYHIGTYWVAFERSACRLCGLFPKSELSLFCVPDCPEYVVMASVPVDEVEGCFRKHVVCVMVFIIKFCLIICWRQGITIGGMIWR